MTSTPLTSSVTATYADLCNVAEQLIAEIINGELYTQPRPSPQHAWVASRLDRKIGGQFDSDGNNPDGWVIIFEPELHLGVQPQILVPDLAGWRRSRMSKLPQTAWFDDVPDWVCEILSPGTRALDRVVKMPIYAQLGVEFLWLVDPEPQTLEAYRNHQGQWLSCGTWGGATTANIIPFENLALDLQSLWSL